MTERTARVHVHKAGVRQATVSDLETGKSRRIDFDILERLARALGMADPRELLEYDQGKRKRRSR